MDDEAQRHLCRHARRCPVLHPRAPLVVQVSAPPTGNATTECFCGRPKPFTQATCRLCWKDMPLTDKVTVTRQHRALVQQVKYQTMESLQQCTTADCDEIYLAADLDGRRAAILGLMQFERTRRR